MNDIKTDIHYTMGSKKLQSEFDESVKVLTRRIEDIVKQVETLNKDFNKRNNKVVENVSNIIHNCLHDTNEVHEELQDIQDIIDAEKVNTSNE